MEGADFGDDETGVVEIEAETVESCELLFGKCGVALGHKPMKESSSAQQNPPNS